MNTKLQLLLRVFREERDSEPLNLELMATMARMKEEELS